MQRNRGDAFGEGYEQFKKGCEHLETKIKQSYTNFNQRSMRENIYVFLNSLASAAKKSAVYSKAGYIQVRRFFHECNEPGIMFTSHQAQTGEKTDWKGLAKFAYYMIHPKGREEIAEDIRNMSSMIM